MDKNYQRLWKGITKTNDETKAVQTLIGILADKEGRNFILHLGRSDAGLCIDILDRGIAKYNLGIAEKQNFFVTLRRLAASHGRLPDSMIITKRIQVQDEILASGGFSDVRSGSMMGRRVAVRTLRVSMHDDIQRIRNQWCKEVVLWNTLSHPNVLKLAGVQGDMGKGQFITVSEWMVHGNVMEYIRIKPVNRLELLHGAAQGLEYLHVAGLIHGDLKGTNILMSNDRPPRACLADFGFMTMVLESDHPMSCSTQLEGGTLTFMPPEILAPQKFGLVNPKLTTQADIYAFGLVIFQVLTGEIPFRSLGPTMSIFAVVEGLRPEKPENASATGLSDSLWGHVQRCWDGDMSLRPRVAEVVTHLGRAAAEWDGVMPPCKTKAVASNSQDSTSDTMKHREIFQRSPSGPPKGLTGSRPTSGVFGRPSTSSRGGAPKSRTISGLFGRLSTSSWGGAPKSRTISGVFSHLSTSSQGGAPKSQAISGVFTRLSMSFTKRNGPPQGGPQEVATPEPVDKPQQENYPHLNQRYKPPPTHLPQKKPVAFKYLKLFFRELFLFDHPATTYKPPNMQEMGTVQAPLHTTHHPPNDPQPLFPSPYTTPVLTPASSAFGVPEVRVGANTLSHGKDESSILVDPDVPACKLLINKSFFPDEIISLIETIFTSRDQVKMIGDLRGDDAQAFVDVIHKALDLLDLPPQLQRKCLSALCLVCGRQALLPKSLQIPLCYNRLDTPLYHGGYGDVWKGEHQGHSVAVKVLRVYSTSDFNKITGGFCKEVVMWKALCHPNVLSLLGVTMGNNQFAMVSEWMTNGNINEFVRANRDANRFKLLKDVATGLIYLHSQAMIHGDLKGANILINQSGHACLADFGLLTTISDPTNFTASSSFMAGGTIRWMSPELLDPDQFGLEGSRPTKESDCYALGMVIYEVLSGRAPFSPLKDFIVMRKVLEGERPGRPKGVEGIWFAGGLWETLDLCWATQPESRPSIEAVVVCLEQGLRVWKPPSLPADKDEEIDGDDWDLTVILGHN